MNYDSGAYGARSVAVGDLDNDGHLDLAVANCSTDDSNACNGVGRVGVLLGNGDGTFRPAVAYSSGGQDGTVVAITDLNGDGNLDVVMANACANRSCPTGSVGVLFGKGNGTLQLPTVYATTGAWGLAVGDLNTDGKPDIVTTSGTVSVLLNRGDGTFAPEVSYDSFRYGSLSGAVADINGDGRPDLVVTLVQGGMVTARRPCS